MTEKVKTSAKTFYFPRDLLKDFIEACAARGYDPNTIVRQAVENWTYHGQAAIESAFVTAILARKTAELTQNGPS